MTFIFLKLLGGFPVIISSLSSEFGTKGIKSDEGKYKSMGFQSVLSVLIGLNLSCKKTKSKIRRLLEIELTTCDCSSFISWIWWFLYILGWSSWQAKRHVVWKQKVLLFNIIPSSFGIHVTFDQTSPFLCDRTGSQKSQGLQNTGHVKKFLIILHTKTFLAGMPHNLQ